MSTAVADNPRLQDLRETTDNRGVTVRVDRENGVIRGVKILGANSANGRKYTPEAMAKAAPLYEGIKVNVNHPKGSATGPRDYQDRIGVHRNVSVKADGLYADFHFNPKHALAEQLIWDAEHAPENVGFSHNAQGRAVRRGGTIYVEEIARVQSVDLVADPATTSSLFEHKEPIVSKTIKQITESVDAKLAGRSALLALVEMDGGMSDMPVAVASDASPEDAVKAGFRTAIMAIVDDDKLDVTAKLAKIRDWLKAQDKLTGEGAKSSDAGGDTTPTPESKGGKSDPKLTELQEEIKQLKARDEVRSLIEAAGVKVDAVQLKAAMLLEGDERKEFIESLPKSGANTNGKPRSATPFKESKGDAAKAPQFKDQAERLAFMRR